MRGVGRKPGPTPDGWENDEPEDRIIMAQSGKNDQPVKDESALSDAEKTLSDAGISGTVVTSETVTPMFLGLSRADMAQVESWNDAIAALGGIEEIDDAAETLGDGTIVVNKDDLIGVKFLITSFSFRNSTDYAGTYALVNGITEDGAKFVFTDGSQEVGIQPTLMRYMETHNRAGGILCRRGLSKSEYTSKTVTDGNGAFVKGTTYHIDLRQPKALNKRN